MKNFDDAFDALMGNEGGYSNNPKDPGGETKFGITKRVANANGYTGDMRLFPLDMAKTIARNLYWTPYQCDQLPGNIAFQVFDAAYNGGHPAQWLQQAAGVTIDGNIGANTIGAVRASDPYKIMMLFDAYRLKYLTSLQTFPVFGKGWVNRIADNLIKGAS